MGQQQLLLLVLTTIIVALAAFAGIQAFSESQRQSAIDQMTQKALDIAIEVQTLYEATSAHAAQQQHRG